MKLKNLKPNAKNPRKISAKQKEMLAKSITAFGDLSGFIYNRRFKRLAGGHQRLTIMPPDAKVHIVKRYEKPTRVGTVAVGYVEVDGERYPYREVDVSAETEVAMNIAANKHGGEFDASLLAEALTQLDAANFDMDLTGFDQSDLAGIMAPTGPVPGEDDIPPVPKVPTSRRGQIWVLGDHRLMCGDSTSKDDVGALMGDDRADLVFTDPPYGVDYDGGHAVKGKRREKLANDDSTTIYDNSVPLMVAYSKPKAALYLWFAATKSLQVLQVLQANGYDIRSWIIWNKNMAQFGAIGAQYKQKHEPCLYCYKRGSSPFWDGPNNEVSVWDVARSSKNEYHPTQKPVELSRRAIGNSCPNGGIVLDLFGGSGATLMGAASAGRRARLMELNEGYCDVIIERWSQATGKKAKLLKP